MFVLVTSVFNSTSLQYYWTLYNSDKTVRLRTQCFTFMYMRSFLNIEHHYKLLCIHIDSCNVCVFRHEYQIFQKITKLEYEFPDGFDSVTRDLVEKLLVSCKAITIYSNTLCSSYLNQMSTYTTIKTMYYIFKLCWHVIICSE